MYVNVTKEDETTHEILNGTLCIIPDEATQGSNYCFNLTFNRERNSYHRTAVVQNCLTVRRRVRKTNRRKVTPDTQIFAKCMVCHLKEAIKTPLSLPLELYNACFSVPTTHTCKVTKSSSHQDILKHMRASLLSFSKPNNKNINNNNDTPPKSVW